jgi:hypothetical protein
VSSESREPLAYLKYVLKNQDNPYVPKVYHLRRFRGKRGDGGWGDDYYVAFIEKLGKYSNLSENQKRKILTKHFGPAFMQYLKDTLKVTSMHGLLGFLVWNLDDDLIKVMFDSNRKSSGAHVPNKHLINVLLFISRFSEEALDLHDGNVMLRGDHPVITDPLI